MTAMVICGIKAELGHRDRVFRMLLLDFSRRVDLFCQNCEALSWSTFQALVCWIDVRCYKVEALGLWDLE